MSDNMDDDIGLDDDSFDDFEKKEGTLGDVIRENAVAKIGIFVVAAIGIFGVISLFGGEEQTEIPSYVPAGAEVTAPPGTEEATPNYIEAIEEENQARLEEAMKQGGSALPTPIDPPVGRLSIPEQEVEEEDPLQRWRALQEERLERELQRTQTLPPEPVIEDTSRNEAVKALSEIMRQQMQAVLDSRSQTQPVTSQPMTDVAWLEDLKSKKEEAEAEAEGEGEGEILVSETVLALPGDIVYAQLLTEANSDNPGPVLAQIAGGPLNGSKILGEFETQEEVLTLSFSQLVYEGEVLDMDAVALDPETTLPGLATDVDHRYFQRIVIPMAAAFVEGMSSAIAESGLTTVTVNGEQVAEETEETDTDQEVSAGVEEAGQELREILDELNEGVEPLIIIEAGTPFGLLFLETVIQTEEVSQ